MNSSQIHPNQVLASLDRADFARIAPHLRPLTLRVRDNIHQPGQRITRVVFPTSGLLSLVAQRLEVGIIGPDGMSAASLLLGAEQSDQECFVQVAGDAVVLESAELERAIAERRSLHLALLRYVHSLLQQTVHTAMANGRCTIEQRLARWLLMSQDRLGGVEIPLTHEFLALMLGTRRPGVTLALQMLEGQGTIKNVRGLVTIRSRSKLERLCEGFYRPNGRLN